MFELLEEAADENASFFSDASVVVNTMQQVIRQKEVKQNSLFFLLLTSLLSVIRSIQEITHRQKLSQLFFMPDTLIASIKGASQNLACSRCKQTIHNSTMQWKARMLYWTAALCSTSGTFLHGRRCMS